MAKVALCIEYDGHRYHGWQRQSHAASVQQTLERVLSKIADQPIEVFCAGRTDTGVHATGQVIHFELDNERPLKAWTMGANTQLPDDIAVRWAHLVADDFHARFSATARRYRYIIANTPTRPAIARSGLTWCRAPLDINAMNEACQFFPGEQDFAAFQAASCQSRTSFRNIHHLFVEPIGQFVVIDIKANAFLHHMVRNIAGSLIEIGRHNQKPQWAKDLIEGRDRTQAAPTASPNGLYLVDVDYPETFGLPKASLGPLFLPERVTQ
ncbi:tRNA pseudouridine(38-40) synthase TruA [Kangiella profundi]|uniref:tRNA pseudouridine synthase A n=1 Tax=Kangiella profundi TaxID=1561924 RepID=A0A2K9AV21_9GAMM|nr:tRNA pseudouridine(38-40) synthase TruA [Kangiella profundi]AUD79001.1 tRNA pseudouridine(38-40) synthase TruA [Kangiella profundi]GGF02318.1 tRNA pseudouridine synthase A [Kangiella profundi]